MRAMQNRKGIFKTKHEFFCKKHACDSCKPIPKRKAKKPIPDEVCKRLVIELDKHPDYLLSDRILIENQPCLMNPMIKSVQMMVFTYFIMIYMNVNLMSYKKKVINSDSHSVYSGNFFVSLEFGILKHVCRHSG